MWQGPHNVSEFLQKFIDLKSRLKDGNLSLFRHGQLSRIFEVVEDHLDPSRMLQLTSSSPIVVSWQQAISQANLYREEKERLQEKNRKKRNEQKKQIEWLEGELSQLKAKIIELEKENVRLNDKLKKSSNEKEESLSSEPQKEGEEKKPRPGML